MTFEQFLDLVDKNYYENEFEMRYGQVIMNTLSRAWPDKYNEMKSNDYDCFYDDGIAEKTLKKLENEWSVS
jgi:hypothetical protein